MSMLSSLTCKPPTVSSNYTSSSSASASSSPHGKDKRVQDAVEVTEISDLPDEMLQMIASKLSEEDAVRMSISSKRWLEIWNRRPRLLLDFAHVLMRTSGVTNPHKVFVESTTKVLNKHHGDLDSCTIRHYISQTEAGTLASWIRLVTLVKHTKELKLENFFDNLFKPERACETLLLPPKIFSHHSLTSLALQHYILRDVDAFDKCSNLKTLRLFNNIISDFRVLNSVFEACSSLEVLMVHMLYVKNPGVLEIKNKKLQFFQFFYCGKIDGIKVHAPRLDVLDLYVICEKENIVLTAPNIPFKINRGVNWSVVPHVSYNISSSLAQEKKDLWHGIINNYCYTKRSLSVVVDLTNPKEVDILKEVLLMWSTREMPELEILFKDNNAPIKEGECSTKLWDDAKPFPDADFRVDTVRMSNFNGSNHGEFALASRFVMQETVTNKLVIKTSSLPPMKKLMTEAAVARLMKLTKGNNDLMIELF